MADYKIFKTEEYTLKDGDTFETIVADKGITVRQLKLFNFGTEDDAEIKKFYWGRLHCSKLNDNGSFKFESSDKPGKLFIPKLSEPPLSFASNGTHQLKLKLPQIDVLKPAKCIVKFRPDSAWDGNYGFDWMREGDTGARGDIRYEDHMADGAELTKLYKAYGQFDVTEAKDDDSTPKNTVAYLNLYPEHECPDKKHTTSIKMKLDQRGGLPAALKVVSPKADYKNFIEIDEVLPKTNGEHNITVKSKVGCAEDIVLNIVNFTNDKKGKDQEIIAGKLIIPKNDLANRPSVKVVFVSVETNINGGRKVVPESFVNNMDTLLQKYCGQAVLHLTIAKENFNLTASLGTKTKLFGKKLFSSIKLTEKEAFNKDWTYELPGGSKTRTILSNTYKLTAGLPPKRKKVHEVLNRMFKAEFPKYKDHFPVFMFNEIGVAIDEPPGPGQPDDIVGLGGETDAIPGDCVVVFGTGINFAVCHELFHCWGLHHPFGSSSPITFRNQGAPGEPQCGTDNIMDYPHFLVPPMDGFQVWSWQWPILKDTLIKKAWS